MSRPPGATQTWHVRPLQVADASGYRELMLQGYRLAPEAFTSTPQERAAHSEDWWRQRIGGPDGDSQSFGVFHGDLLVGAVALSFSDRTKTRHKAELLGLYVQDAQRGTGAGRALMTLALAHARRRQHLRSVVLTVTEGNAPALALYGSLGFEVFGHEPMAIRTADGYRAKLHLWLRL